MFWGILVHAGTVAPVSMFQRIGELSGLVRMESFFLISGLLTWMILNKYGTAVVLKKRALVIGLPFAVSLLLLNPLTNWLIHNYHNPPQSFGGFLAGRQIDPVAGPINWHLHLWFLAALIVYTLLAPWIKRGVDVGMRFLAPKSSIRSEELRFLALSTAVVAGCLGARIVFEFALEAWLPESLEFVARSVGNYLPFYALGMLLSAAAGLRGVFSQVHLVQTTLACLLLAVAHRLPDGCPKWAMESFILAAQTYVAVCLSSVLFWAARKWLGSESKMMRSLAESAYTVYLFHFLFLYLCAFVLRGWVRNDFLLLLLISAGTFTATWCVHRFLIRRVGLLKLLFNGKVG